MARLLGPDNNSRMAVLPSGAPAASRTGTVYANAAGTVLADILAYQPGNPTVPGAAIAGSVVTTDAYGMLPLFWWPDSIDVVWISVNGGPVVPINADYDARLDAAEASLATKASTAALAALDLKLGRSNMAGGRTPVANGHGNSGSQQYPPNWAICLRTLHTATTALSDLRLVYRSTTATETDSSFPSNLKVGLEFPTATITPVTFGGKQVGQLEPNGVLISDPIPVDIAAGSTFWTRTYSFAPSGIYTTVTTGVAAGVSTFQIAALPLVTSGVFSVGNTTPTRELVTVTSITGSANPYTVNLAAPTTLAHALNDWFGQGVLTNRFGYGDLGEGSSGSDQAYSGTIAVPGASTTTLAQAATAGDVTIKVVNSAGLSPTVTLGAETLTIKNITGTANPYTVYLTAALASSYTSGTTVTATYGGTAGFAPTVIAADRTQGAVATPVIIAGDSIATGVGYNLRSATSFVTLAFGSGRPVINAAISGESAQQYAAYTTSRRRRQLISLAGWMFYEYGVNDIYGNRTLAQVQADTTAILTLARNRSLKTAVMTLTPRTTSTDGWTTTANQAIVNAGFNTVRLNYNAWVRAGAGGLADLVVEMADVVETSRDSGIWKIHATDGPYTADGIHPSMVGHQTMANAFPVGSFI